MKLISLSITNLRKIRAAELDFDGPSLVEVRGRNGAGKSTVIDSIIYLLRGSKAIPAGAVTLGEDKATIIGKIGEYTVRRVIDAEGRSTLTVDGGNGKIARPQEFLDQLSGQFVDPEKWMSLPSLEKRSLLLSYAGIDFADIDARIEEAEQERLLVGRYLKSLGTLPPEPEAVEPVEVADLLKQRAEILKYNEEQRERARNNRALVAKYRDRIVDSLREPEFPDFSALRSFLAGTIRGLDEDAKKITWVPDLPERPLDDIDAALADSTTINVKADAHAAWVRSRDAIAAKKAEYDAADAEVKRLREEKHGMVAGVKLPAKGLEITETGLALNGVPDQNWSASEALKVAMNVAIAYSGELKAVYIKRGEALDGASLKKIRDYAEKAGFQVIIEIVDDTYAKDGDGVIYIDDGETR